MILNIKLTGIFFQVDWNGAVANKLNSVTPGNKLKILLDLNILFLWTHIGISRLFNV